MKRKETNLKMSFKGIEPIFYVNKAKKTVACKISGYAYETTLNTWYGELTTPVYKVVGIAYCNDNDEFDEERGKRIALAKAENKLYAKCADYYNKEINKYTSYIEKMILFNKKAEKFCTHNEKYINDISEVDSPNYKKNIKPIKRGQVFYTKK